jgi:hypothetical protein
MNRIFLATSVAMSLWFSATAHAQDQTEEIEELRQRVKQLEDRLDQQSTTPEPATTTAEPGLPSTATQPTTTSGAPAPTSNKFNPAISLILNAKYRYFELDPNTYTVGGFVPPGGHGHGSEEEGGHGGGFGPGDRGFSLDETELAFSANVDPYWFGFVQAGILDGEVDIEEAYVQNSGYVPGLLAKAGRFFSGMGYINEQHPHAWDFVDAPLVQLAMNGINYGDDGFQFRYVAPTPLFLEFGLEAGRGANFPGSERNKNGPNAYVGFVHLGGDVGFSNSYQIGASYRDTNAEEREYDDEDSLGTEVENIFSDLKSKTYGVDFVWKWAPNGDPSVRNFKFQAEYYRRKEDGQLEYDIEGDSAAGTQDGPYSSEQDGWYAQAVWQFMPRWRVGARYDLLDSGTLKYGPISNGSLSRDDLQQLREHKPERATIMVDFSTSEYARFRLQYSQDKARFDKTDNQVIFQYVVSLGAHGAHKF